MKIPVQQIIPGKNYTTDAVIETDQIESVKLLGKHHKDNQPHSEVTMVSGEKLLVVGSPSDFLSPLPRRVQK